VELRILVKIKIAELFGHGGDYQVMSGDPGDVIYEGINGNNGVVFIRFSGLISNIETPIGKHLTQDYIPIYSIF
jgi:hypothetical protein